MKNKIPSNWKVCATCTNWAGKQIPDSFNQNVDCDLNERAQCCCSSSNWFRSNVCGNTTCPKWTARFRP